VGLAGTYCVIYTEIRPSGSLSDGTEAAHLHTRGEEDDSSNGAHGMARTSIETEQKHVDYIRLLTSERVRNRRLFNRKGFRNVDRTTDLLEVEQRTLKHSAHEQQQRLCLEKRNEPDCGWQTNMPTPAESNAMD
jgi:hypothetical protein